jgi:serine phosphatase RsbU (regulator of sigma subunit)
MFSGSEFQTGEVALQPEDLVVLYSDGITEARSSDDEEFGEKRLQALIEMHSGAALADVQAEVLEAVRNWAGDEPEDDMTLLMVRATMSDKLQFVDGSSDENILQPATH